MKSRQNSTAKQAIRFLPMFDVAGGGDLVVLKPVNYPEKYAVHMKILILKADYRCI